MEKSIKEQDMVNPLCKEIISGFIAIENKILDLKKCSSDDFDELHDKLIDNLSLSESLSQKYDKIFDLFGKFGNQKVLENLVGDYKETKSYLGEMSNVIEDSVNSLDNLAEHLSLVSIPLDNFNQNLSSLKLLLVNIKLVNTCNNRSLHGFGTSESEMIEKVIDKVKDVCPVIKENIFVLKSHLTSLQKDINDLKNSELLDLMNEAILTQGDVGILITQINEILEEKPVIEKKTDDCYNRINGIIKDLQFKEKFQREVNYFQSTHDGILKKLVETGNGKHINGSFYAELKKNQIPKITDSQVFRLMQLNKEYQFFVEKTSSGMINNRNEIYSILHHSKHLFSKLNINKEVDSNIKNFISKLSEVLIKYKNFSSEVNLVYKVVKDLNEKFLDVEMMERAVEQKIIDKIHNGDILNWADETIAQQAQKIYKLYADNHFEKSKLNRLFGEAFDSINGIIKTNAVFSFKNNTLKKLEETLGNSQIQFDKLNHNINITNQLKQEILHTGKKIADNVENAVEQNKYYGFFEKTARQVILQLDNTNRKIKNSNSIFDKLHTRKNDNQIIDVYDDYD